MKLPVFRRISAADFPDQPWISKLLIPLNLFIEQVRQGLDKGITSENIAEQIQEVQFQTASDYILNKTFNFLEFSRKINTKAKGVEILDIQQLSTTFTPITDATTLSWLDTGNGQIRIYFITGLKDSTNYNVRMRVS